MHINRDHRGVEIERQKCHVRIPWDCLRLPPGGGVRAEIRLRPRREDRLAINVVAMRKREREGRWATDNLAGRVILRSVARAHVLVLGTVPWNDAAKVRADSVDSIVLERTVLLHDEIMRIALRTSYAYATSASRHSATSTAYTMASAAGQD